MRQLGASLFVLFALAAPVRAQDATEGRPPEQPSTEAPRAPSYWARGEPRPFISGAVDLGFLFLRPRFHFGYGRPHFTWIGLEANPLVSSEGIGVYGGLRG